MEQQDNDTEIEEVQYRDGLFKDVKDVLSTRLSCTCCLKDVKVEFLDKRKIYIHPLLKVLVCKECKKFYGDGNFSCDEDGSAKYCRWCGQGGNLFLCSKCPVAICKICVTRNLARSARRAVERDDWECFVCKPEPIYELRATAWALKKLKELQKQKHKKGKKRKDIDYNSYGGFIESTKNGISDYIKQVQQLCRSLNQSLTLVNKKVESSNLKELTSLVDSMNSSVESTLSNLTQKRDNFKASWSHLEPDLLKYSELDVPVNGVSESSAANRCKNDDTEQEDDDVQVSKTEKRSSVKNSKHANDGDKNESTEEGPSTNKKQLLKSNFVEEDPDSSVVCISDSSSIKSNQDDVPEDIDSDTKPHENALTVPETDSNTENESACENLNISGLSTVNDDTENNATLNEDNNERLETEKNESIDKEENVSIDKEKDGSIDKEKDGSIDKEKDGSSHQENNDIVDGENNTTANKESSEAVDQEENIAIEEKEKSSESNDLESKEGEADSENQEVRKPFLRVKKVEELNSLFPSNSSDASISNHVNSTDADSCVDQESVPNSTDNARDSLGKLKSLSDKKRRQSDVSKTTPKKTKQQVEKKVENSSLKVKNTPSKTKTLDSSSSSSDSSSSSSSANSDEVENTRVKRKTKKLKQVKEELKTSTPLKKKEKTYDSSSDEDSEIKRLLNMKSLEMKRKKGKTSSSSEEGTIEKTKKPKKGSAKKEKNKKGTVLDSLESDSDNSVDLLNSVKTVLIETPEISELYDSEMNNESITPLSEEEKKYSDIFDSDGSILDLDSEKKKSAKNKQSVKRRNSDPEIKSEKSEESNDSLSNQKKSSWKNDTLLRKKLSDDSDSSDTFQKKKVKKKCAKSRIQLLSDSDTEKKVEKLSSSLSSSSEEEKMPKSKKRKRIKVDNSSDGSSEGGKKNESPNKGQRKNIRKILKTDSQKETTLSAQKDEEERKRRITEKQKLYNQLMQEVELMQGKVDQLILEFDVENKKSILSVDQDLVKKLKPHQAEGIKFMWESCFESIKKAKKGVGSGCILAHCMGLGKTLQVVSLVHTLIMHEDLGIKTILVLCPLSTVLNWVNEFDKWLSDVGSGEDVEVFHFKKSTAVYRAHQLKEWHRQGGVFIMGYNLFRTLVNPTKKIKLSVRNTFLETLTDPGADLVICDEGHVLKNEATALSKSVSKIKTLRRIVLTGTPLQNNLIEYHCMVQFVKPHLLGTKKEFTNRFVNPINNGQFVDSTERDVKVMKRRAHVLHKMLDGLVQRKDYNVLVPFLPPKFEYVLSLSMSEVQCELYKHYLENISRKKEEGTLGATLFKDRNYLNLICAHPRLLKIHSQNELLKREDEESDEEGSLKDFIDDETSSSSSSSSSSSNDDSSIKSISSSSSGKVKRSTRNNPQEPVDEPEIVEQSQAAEEEWWSSLIKEEHFEDIRVSTKLWLFFVLLQKCGEIGDKILLFSQSLMALDLIEYFLDKIDSEGYLESPPEGLCGFTGTWVKGLDYFRLDGKSSSENRSMWCNHFNNDNNLRARLFLISTRAGGMGINLTGANRVIIFDASWNPSHDVQSIFRIYRFGQTKPCYIYRFLSKGTMEHKVYDRQVTKLSMACRVIDEQQIDRHFSYSDLNELYTFTPNEKDDKTPQLPKDRLLADILQEHKDFILNYHTHDSLLENQADEELNEEERKAAWLEFENEKTALPVPNSYDEMYKRVYAVLQQREPTWNEEEWRNGANELMSKVLAQQQMLQQPQQNYQQQMQVQQQQPQFQQKQPQFQMRMTLQERQQQALMFMQQQSYMRQQQMNSIQGLPRQFTQNAQPNYNNLMRAGPSQMLQQQASMVPPQRNLLVNPYAMKNSKLPFSNALTARAAQAQQDTPIETVVLDEN